MSLDQFTQQNKHASLKGALRRMRSLWLSGEQSRFDLKLSRVLGCSLDYAAKVRESWLNMGFLAYDKRGLLIWRSGGSQHWSANFGTSVSGVEKFWRKRKRMFTCVKERENVTINEVKKRLNGHKRAIVQTRYCQDCEESSTHETGSQLWLSCRLQDGWRSINSTCNLPEQKREEK